MQNKFRYEVITVVTYKTRSLLGAVVDQVNHIVKASCPEEARDIVLKRDVSDVDGAGVVGTGKSVGACASLEEGC